MLYTVIFLEENEKRQGNYVGEIQTCIANISNKAQHESEACSLTTSPHL